MVELRQRPKWHIERTVPVAVITGMLIQLVVVVWMASKYDSRITEHDNRISKLEQREIDSHAPLTVIVEKLAKIEGRLEYILPPTRSKDGIRP